MKVWKIITQGDDVPPIYVDKLAIWDKLGGLDSEKVGRKYLIEVVDINPDVFYNQSLLAVLSLDKFLEEV